MKLIIDMMGGDNGAKVTVEAVKVFAKENPKITFFCVGNPAELTQIQGFSNINILPARSVLKMDVDPMDAMKDKESSIYKAIDLYLELNADGLVTAGSTAATLTLATLKLKRLEKVTRPGLITPFPTYKKGKKFVAIDLGANTLNTATELHQFAIMGSLYYKLVFNVEAPKVALLNIGTEEEKGDELRKNTYQLLKEDKTLNFVGNVEARDPLFGEIDVLVADGFSGNIFLKSSEGACKVMAALLKDAFKKSIFTRIGYLFTKKGVKELKERMDYKGVGGAMLLGINGIVIKAHGNSDFKGFTSALNMAYNLASKDLIKKIKESL